MAKDLFVHHFGSRTFAGNGVNASALLEENERRFAEKWGLDTPQGRRVALRAWTNPIPDAGFRIPDSRSTCESVPKGEDRGLTPPARLNFPSSVPGAPLPGRSVSERTTDHRQRARVSLTMIVRDEEKNLPHCLESVRGIFDEIVVVDTGSTDRTVEIARSFGARVFDFVWVEDFAAARNAPLARSTGDRRA